MRLERLADVIRIDAITRLLIRLIRIADGAIFSHHFTGRFAFATFIGRPYRSMNPRAAVTS